MMASLIEWAGRKFAQLVVMMALLLVMTLLVFYVFIPIEARALTAGMNNVMQQAQHNIQHNMAQPLSAVPGKQ